MSIGEQIRNARLANNMTQSALSAKSGISAVMISQYERGVRTPKLEQLEKISVALSLYAGDFLGFETLLNEEASELLKKQNAKLAVRLDALPAFERSALVNALDSALMFSNFLEDSVRSEAILTLCELMHAYGLMVSESQSIADSSVDNPSEYLRFIQSFEKIIDIISKYRSDTEMNALVTLGDDSGLFRLVNRSHYVGKGALKAAKEFKEFVMPNAADQEPDQLPKSDLVTDDDRTQMTATNDTEEGE